MTIKEFVISTGVKFNIKINQKDMHYLMRTFSILLLFTLLVGCNCGEKIGKNRAVIFINDNNIALSKVKTRGCIPTDSKYQIEIYNTNLQTCEINLNCLMIDKTSMTFKYKVGYVLTKDKLPDFYNKFGKDYIKMFVRPEIRAMSRNMLSIKNPNELTGDIVSNLLKDKIIDNKVWSDYLTIKNVDLIEMKTK